MSQRRRRHRLRESILTAGALLGVVSILLAVAAATFGITPLIFRSGSMSPAVETGDLGIARTVSADELRPGDIVSVLTSRGVRITHRVVSTEDVATGTALVLRGDANEEPDAETYTVTEADRLLFAIPKAGYVAAWLAGSGGVFLGGLLIGSVLLVLLARPKPSGGPAGRRRADTTARVSTLALVAVALTLPGLAPRPSSTLAAWTDPVSVTNATTVGYQVPAPAYDQTCTLGGSGANRTVAYSWPANVAPLPLLSYDITVTGITATTAVSTVGATSTVTVSFSTTNANRNKVVTLTGVGWPTGATTWKSAATTTWKFRTNGNMAAATCGETTPPTVSFTQPVNGAATTRAAQISTSNSACASTPACGSSSDAGATTMQFRFERTIGGTVTCWATSWSAANCSTAWRAVGGTSPAWRLTGTATNAYGSAGTYTLSIQATDAYDNVTTQSITFTLT